MVTPSMMRSNDIIPAPPNKNHDFDFLGLVATRGGVELPKVFINSPDHTPVNRCFTRKITHHHGKKKQHIFLKTTNHPHPNLHPSIFTTSYLGFNQKSQQNPGVGGTELEAVNEREGIYSVPLVRWKRGEFTQLGMVLKPL